MTILLSANNISKSYPLRPLFTDFSLQIFERDRLGLMGPNGSGKSTFLQILLKQEVADEGVIALRDGVTMGYVAQSSLFPALSAREVLVSHAKQEVAPYEVEMWLSKISLRGDEIASSLSGGWQKRLAIAAAMINKPDILLLDEPTNHLDLEGILWLEGFLEREVVTYLLVSHDRAFLQKSVDRVIEMNKAFPKGFFEVKGSYELFLEKKEEFLAGQIEKEKSMQSKARREVAWLASNAKARTTKSTARIDAAGELLSDLSQIKGQNRQKKAAIDFAGSERETRKLISLKNVGKEPLFSKLDLLLSPGSRLGLIGRNGSGKTTLLRLLLGEILPDAGTIKKAEGLKIVYFDQHRLQIPLHTTLRHALSPRGDYVQFRGQEIHVHGWCQRFLFSKDLLDIPLSRLSGGERARISIAHLMLQEADLLLLDEPTNDLDIPTLETLEESLLEFPGALVLITHDRCMLERVCNQFLALGEGGGFFHQYKAWEGQIGRGKKKEAPKKEEPQKKKSGSGQVLAQIEKLEAEVKALYHALEGADPASFAKLGEEIALREVQIERLYLQYLS